MATARSSIIRSADVLRRQCSGHAPSQIASSSALTLNMLQQTFFAGSSSRRPYSAKPSFDGQTFVLLRSLPTTATHNDVRSLCLTPDYLDREKVRLRSRQAISRSVSLSPEEKEILDKEREEFNSSEDVAAQLQDIRMIRSAFLHPTGSALVDFKRFSAAQRFVQLANQKLVGGKRVEALLISRNAAERELSGHGKSSRVLRLLNIFQIYSPGRVVLVKGLPLQYDEEKVKRIVSGAYELAPRQNIRLPDLDHGVSQSEVASAMKSMFDEDGKLANVARIHLSTPQNETTSAFLIRFANVSDAMRFVRKWHMVFFQSLKRPNESEEMPDRERSERDGLHRDKFGSDTPELETFERQYPDDRSSLDLAEELGLRKIPWQIDARIMY